MNLPDTVKVMLSNIVSERRIKATSKTTTAKRGGILRNSGSKLGYFVGQLIGVLIVIVMFLGLMAALKVFAGFLL
jgi:hypothetical protein